MRSNEQKRDIAFEMEKMSELANQLKDIIWWAKTIDNPIYDIKDGKRIPRDLYQIRLGFVKKYNELKSMMEEGKNAE